MIVGTTIQTSAFSRIVGAEHVRPATSHDAIDGVSPGFVVEPGDAAELARILAQANDQGAAIVTRGGGTKMDRGGVPRHADVVLSTARLHRVVEHTWGDMTATVEAGCTVGRLQETLAEHNQRLAIDCVWAERATVGGVLATNDGGASRVRFGGLRDHVIGVRLALADGTLARSGGKVVKNVAGYDLPKLVTGSLGTLGVIVEATFRLYPLPAATHTLCFSLPTFEHAADFMLGAGDSSLVPTGLQMYADSNQPPRVAVRFEGDARANEAQGSKLVELSRAFDAELVETAPDEWRRDEELFEPTGSEIVCKLAVLPDRLAQVYRSVERLASSGALSWRIVAQAFGVCLLRLEGMDNSKTTIETVKELRAEAEAAEGSLVVLRCPPAMKSEIDVWGTTGDALGLMRRIKNEFDPKNTLNPGRFVGGI